MEVARSSSSLGTGLHASILEILLIATPVKTEIHMII